MATPLLAIISPYDLACRAASVFVSSLLAEETWTVLPTPHDAADLEALRAAGAGSPMFLRLAQSWAWSGALWRAGVIAPGEGLSGTGLASEMRAAQARVANEPALAALLPLIERDAGLDATERFEALCRDLLLGGANPAVSIPLTAAVESVASRSGRVLVRITPASVAGKLERGGARPAVRLSIAAVIEGEAEDILSLRGSMMHTLDALRAALGELLEVARDGEDPMNSPVFERFESARAAYEDVLQQRVESLRMGRAESARRIKLARVSITGALAEPGSSLGAAAGAARVLHGHAAASTKASPSPRPGTALATRAVTILTVKPLRVDV